MIVCHGLCLLRFIIANTLTHVLAPTREYCKFDIGESGTKLLQHGFMDVAHHCTSSSAAAAAATTTTAASPAAAASTAAAAASVSKAELESWKSLLADYSPALVGMASVDVDFVWSVWSVFQRVFAPAASASAGSASASVDVSESVDVDVNVAVNAVSDGGSADNSNTTIGDSTGVVVDVKVTDGSTVG